MRTTFEALKKDPQGASSELLGLMGLINPATGNTNKFLSWMDFSLLPEFERVSKYFHIMVYSGGASVDGLSMRVFTPVPPALKK